MLYICVIEIWDFLELLFGYVFNMWMEFVNFIFGFILWDIFDKVSINLLDNFFFLSIKVKYV